MADPPSYGVDKGRLELKVCDAKPVRIAPLLRSSSMTTSSVIGHIGRVRKGPRANADLEEYSNYCCRSPERLVGVQLRRGLWAWIARHIRPEPDRFWLRFGYLERVL
jgi:hypothetical protein